MVGVEQDHSLARPLRLGVRRARARSAARSFIASSKSRSASGSPVNIPTVRRQSFRGRAVRVRCLQPRHLSLQNSDAFFEGWSGHGTPSFHQCLRPFLSYRSRPAGGEGPRSARRLRPPRVTALTRPPPLHSRHPQRPMAEEHADTSPCPGAGYDSQPPLPPPLARVRGPGGVAAPGIEQRGAPASQLE
jgi:hypothetical protein